MSYIIDTLNRIEEDIKKLSIENSSYEDAILSKIRVYEKIIARMAPNKIDEADYTGRICGLRIALDLYKGRSM